jgi:hypothetical protein
MEIKLDSDVQAVAEFMQANVSATKLVSVAEDLSKIGRLLWSRYPQEPSLGLTLLEPQPTSGSLPSASESALVPACVGGDSGAAVGSPRLR